MTEALLAVGIVLTAGHVLLDLRQFTEHVRHPRDWLTLVSALCLVGHVILTGEAGRWLELV